MLGLTSVCVFLFSALALAVNSGYSVGALVLLLASGSLLWKRPGLALQRQDYLLIGVLLAYFLIFTANMLYHGDPPREFDMPLRALLAIPVLLLLLAYPPRPMFWWAGLSVGAIAGATYALMEFIPDSLIRPQAATSNPIHYGNVSMLLGILALCGLDWARLQAHRYAWSGLLLAGCLAGIVGSVISGSRGGWLALPVCLIIMAIHHAKNHGRRHLTVTLSLLFVLVGLAYAIPHSPVQQRVATVISELQKYKNDGDVSTSVGQRLVMWDTATELVKEHLWLGMGRTGYLQQKKVMLAEGKISKLVSDYTNAHSDYLDVLVKRGITGVLALLALLLLPLILFARTSHRGPVGARPFALAGMLLCTCYMIFGLTTSSLTLNIGIIMLVFPMVILWALLRQQERIA